MSTLIYKAALMQCKQAYAADDLSKLYFQMLFAGAFKGKNKQQTTKANVVQENLPSWFAPR